MDKEEQKTEAIERLKMLHLHPNVLKEFGDEDKLNLSESGGILYWLNDEQQALVKKFETEHSAVVYHVIHNFTQFGELFSMLYVSKDQDEWEMDREDLKQGWPMVYVENLTDEDCSEFGTIGIESRAGGLIRTA